MTISTFDMPEQSEEYAKHIQGIQSGNELYFTVSTPESMTVLTGNDMPEMPIPASVYIGQLTTALDRLGLRTDFDAAVKKASADVNAWLESGGELLTDDARFIGIIPAEQREIVFKLAATI